MALPNTNTATQLDSDLDLVRNLISGEMGQVNDLIQARLHSDVSLINQLGHYIVNSGGKRLRPALVLLSAGVFSYQGQQHISLAAIIELIHTACLLHDDVVDASLLRRGQETANQRWGNEASVLVGDFLYSRAFQMMVEVGSLDVMEIMSETTNTIAEGEVQQLLNRHDPGTSQERYLDVIIKKTAKLFEAAAEVGAVICDRSRDEIDAMAAYGKHLGIAYQLIDDVLDYSASSEQLGKNIGDDLSEGKPTLPLLYAMHNSADAHTDLIRLAIEKGGLDDLAEIQNAIERTGAIAYTAQLAQEEANKAITAIRDFPQSEYLDSLYALARFAVQRAN